MDPGLSSLLNIGGVGILAAVLLMLHRDAIKAFQNQLDKERALNQSQWQSYMEIKIRHHEQLIAQLLNQDKMLDHLASSQARIHERLGDRLAPPT